MKLLSLAVLVIVAIGFLVQASPADPKPKRFEYLLLTECDFPTLKKTMWVAKDFKIPDNSTIPDAINQIGNEGWELVSVLPDMRSSRDSPMTTYYFKK